MTANGFSSRRFRTRSSRTAAEDVASHARWKPPIPFRATMPPSDTTRAAVRIGSPSPPADPSASIATRRGPQSGHAFGCA